MEKMCRVVAYMRIEPEDNEPMTKEEVAEEIKHLSFLQPENIYDIEEVE